MFWIFIYSIFRLRIFLTRTSRRQDESEREKGRQWTVSQRKSVEYLRTGIIGAEHRQAERLVRWHGVNSNIFVSFSLSYFRMISLGCCCCCCRQSVDIVVSSLWMCVCMCVRLWACEHERMRERAACVKSYTRIKINRFETIPVRCALCFHLMEKYCRPNTRTHLGKKRSDKNGQNFVRAKKKHTKTTIIMLDETKKFSRNRVKLHA